MIWYPHSQPHKINFMNRMSLFHKEWYIMYKIILIAPTASSIKILIDLSCPTWDHIYTPKYCTPNMSLVMLMWPTLLPQSNPQRHYTLKFTRLRTPSILGLCCLLLALRYCNAKKIDVDAGGFQVNTKQRGPNDCQQGGKESETRRREV